MAALPEAAAATVPADSAASVGGATAGNPSYRLLRAPSAEEADLFSALGDAPLTKLFLHAARDKFWTHALFPEVAANGRHL